MRIRFLVPSLLAGGVLALCGCAALDALAGGLADGSIDPSGAAAAGAEATGASGSTAAMITLGIGWALREAAGQYLRWRGKRKAQQAPADF